MTDYTYVPATGRITKHRQSGTKNAAAPGVGQVPPMGTGETGRDMDLARVSRVDGKEPVGVMEVLTGRGGGHGGVTGEYMDTCREIMLLPALLKAATYTGLHGVFTGIPLEEIDSRCRVLDSLGQPAGSDARAAGARQMPDLYVRFDAKKHHTYRNEKVNDLYSGPADLDMAKLHGMLEGWKREHEQCAFDALGCIRKDVHLDDFAGDTNNESIVVKLGRVISDTRTRYGSTITHLVMGNRMWQRCHEDPRFRGTDMPESPADTSEVLQVPGLGCVTAVTDLMEDNGMGDVIYAVDRRRGALYGQGRMELWLDGTSRTGGTGISEYYQYMITDNHAKRADGEPVERRTALRIIVP